MKTLLLLLFITIFASCTAYRYVKVDSDMPRNKDNGFIAEKDSMQVSYNFFGANGPLQMEVHNKTAKGMVLDLNRSALVVNGRSASFYRGEIIMSGESSGSSFQWTRRYSNQSGDFSAAGTQQPEVLFIPAGSFISINPIYVTDDLFDSIPDARFKKEQVMDIFNTPVYIRKTSYNQSESPLNFTTHLTFVSSDNERKEYTQKHAFYISEIVKSDQKPEFLNYSASQSGDRFYISRTRGAGMGGALLLTALAVGAAAIDKDSKAKN